MKSSRTSVWTSAVFVLISVYTTKLSFDSYSREKITRELRRGVEDTRLDIQDASAHLLASERLQTSEALYYLSKNIVNDVFRSVYTDSVLPLCLARSALVGAVRMRPTSAKYLVAVADLDTILKNPGASCASLSPEIELPPPAALAYSPSEVLNRATELAPWNGESLYNGAIVHLRIGEREAGFSKLRNVAERSPHFSTDQRAFTISLIQTERELEAALPRKFPEVLRWVAFYQNSRPAELREYSRTFSLALLDAAQELRGRNTRNDLKFAGILQMSKLAVVTAHDDVRKYLDAMLSEVADEGSDLRSYYAYRSQHSRQNVAKAFVPSDTAPGRTPLGSWVPDLSSLKISVQGAGFTLGIFLPPGTASDLLILEGATPSCNTKLFSSLSFFGSADNESYHPVMIEKPEFEICDESRKLIGLSLKNFHERYLKIHTEGDSIRAVLGGSISDVCQVYRRS